MLHNNWMDEATQKGEITADEDPMMRELKLKMISRQEDVQARKKKLDKMMLDVSKSYKF